MRRSSTSSRRIDRAVLYRSPPPLPSISRFKSGLSPRHLSSTSLLSHFAGDQKIALEAEQIRNLYEKLTAVIHELILPAYQVVVERYQPTIDIREVAVAADVDGCARM